MSALPVAKRRPGRQPIEITAKMRKSVSRLAALGVPQEEIATIMHLSSDTLQRRFRRELDTGATIANAKMAGYLFKNGEEGNVTAQIFWLKTRARWREAPTAHELLGPGGGPLEIIHMLLDDIDAKSRGVKTIEHEPKEKKNKED